MSSSSSSSNHASTGDRGDEFVVLTKLDLSDSNTGRLEPNSYLSRKYTELKLQQLLLRRNRLKSLDSYAKALFQFRDSLTELSLKENLFTQFPIEITTIHNLTSLSLANNQIESIPRDTLSKLRNLQWLNLSHNRLKGLPTDLGLCSKLRGVDLDSNQITEFPEPIFNLSMLEVLLMQKNKIKTIPPGHNFPKTLNTLNLGFNQLTTVPFTLIHQPPSSLTHLHLSGNKLRVIPSDFLSDGHPSLISLDLHTCRLTRLSPDFLQSLSSCPNLRRLNLAINELEELPTEIGHLSQLQWLNLNDNRLEELPESFGRLIHLVKLGLVQNRLDQLPTHLFSHMLELQKLDIRRNQIRYLPASILMLVPRQEVDSHVALSVPQAVFDLQPACSQDCTDGHPYGGSLRTLLVNENPCLEFVDGILCDLEQDFARLCPLHQAESVTLEHIRSLTSPICYSSQFRRLDQVNLLSEIDDPIGDTTMTEQELALLRKRTLTILNGVFSLREVCLRQQLRLARSVEAVPDLLVKSLQSARICDFCKWAYTESDYQVAYLIRLCNNRVQVPVRFQVCSLACAHQSLQRIQSETMSWHARQSLAHIDVTFSSLPVVTIGQQDHPAPRRLYPSIYRSPTPPVFVVEEPSPTTYRQPAPLPLTRLVWNKIKLIAISLFGQNQMNLSNPTLTHPDSDRQEPPSLNTVATQIIEGRLHTDRVLPQLRLATPSPNPLAFNHLPKDAIRLERF